MNLLKKAQAAAGASINDRPTFSKPQSETSGDTRKKAVAREYGTLKYRAPQQMRDETGKPLKLEGGEKFQYSEDEQREFAGTDYANGMLVSLYEGELRDQRRDGTGTYTYTRGENFDGTWRNDKRHGQGVLSMTTGHRYEGDWQNDFMSGTGREQFVKGEVYTGNYANGRMTGKGVLDYNTTGTLFEGEWLDGRKHGKGRILYSNGDIFEGTWQHGRRHGRGTTTYAKGGKVYTSQWVDGKMVDGMKFVRDSGPPPDAGATFSGQTVANEHGIQLKSGPGTVRFSNGDTVEGTWVDGKREGQATIRYAKGGRTYSSTWKDGQLVGDMVYLGEASNPFQHGSPQRDNSLRRRIKLDKTTILPLDISKWKPKKNISRPSTDSFLRLQLAFEDLDKDAQMCIRVGSLAEALTANSGGDTEQYDEILQAADRDNTGDVDLYSLLRAWYPQALRSDVDKYLATFITPKELLQHRGEICGVPSSNKGFIHVADGGGELSLETLLRIGSAIGTERFTETQFRKSVARTDKETVNFIGLLDVWYENVPIDMIARSELNYLPEGDLEAILHDFNNYQQDGNLAVQEFKEAQDRYQLWLAQYGSSDEVPFLSLPSTPQDSLHFAMLPGAFKGEPYWPLGPITLTVRMLEVIDKMQGRWVELIDLICFNYPNISCSHTREKFLDRKPTGKECTCEIHQALNEI
eukprot:TRINITY_DN276_c0_g3_i1.p1 TRINITY_DN276_c0_g3~~TRINITY_DN276_c0_g3_i1.p1  ORF type:complete len:692 (+),score=107.40 TRINITY_DN276_c0_g3_i1:2297-4372(+)